MTSMSRVATEGSVSGSRLVTQNMLLGLDKGWMMGRGTATENTGGLKRTEEHLSQPDSSTRGYTHRVSA